MPNALPAWVDESLSRELPTIRDRGENQENEFKENIPDQLHKLGESVAAMATSGGGDIFTGIRDDGSLLGIDVDTATKRDQFVLRLKGIIGKVDPIPSVEYVFAIENDCSVLVCRVGKQNSPVYYYDGRPYVRDGAQKRRARPDEVQELVWRHPSSEHKRKLEELDFESTQRFVRQMADQREAHSRQLDEQRQQFTDRLTQ